MAFAPLVAFDYLRRAQAGGRLGHAYLLIGGADAFDLARQLAARGGGGAAAGVLGHADVHVIEPESKSRRIVIEQVRNLEDELGVQLLDRSNNRVALTEEGRLEYGPMDLRPPQE